MRTPKRFSISSIFCAVEQCYMHAFRTYIFAKAYTHCSTVWLQ